MRRKVFAHMDDAARLNVLVAEVKRSALRFGLVCPWVDERIARPPEHHWLIHDDGCSARKLRITPHVVEVLDEVVESVQSHVIAMSDLQQV